MRSWLPGEALPGAERPFFLPHRGELLAVVHHEAAGAQPCAAVVLAGPMSLERSHGYLAWVRWARTLAANGYEVLRFDYRGVGESTGDFSAQTFDTWRDDLAAVVAHASGRGLRVVVLGLRLGALLGLRLFEEGACDAFVAWDPPAGGKPLLMDTLRRKLAADYLELAGDRKTRDDYVRALAAGEVVEVEGYPWARGLWASAPPFTFGTPQRSDRPWLAVRLDGRPVEQLPDAVHCASVRIPRPPFWLQSGTLVPELTELFAVTLRRLDAWSEAWPAAQVAAVPARSSAQDTPRAIEVLDLPAGRCVGTHHRPAQRSANTGLLWLNFGYVPRDGHGGLAAHASEVMARHGVPSFRYDLPGLGDAPGFLPENTQAFYPLVTAGHYTEVTRQLVDRLCETQGLDGLVLAGLCGGAINAIYVGDVDRRRVRGLVLLEPELYVTEPGKEVADAGDSSPRWWRGAVRARLFSYWGWMRLLTHENRYARFVPLPRKAILDFVLSRTALPSVTNLPLTHAWQRWVQAKRPTLVVTADGKLREVFLDRINQTVLSGIERRNYQHVRLKRTNHIFTSGGAIETVTRHLEQAWPMLVG